MDAARPVKRRWVAWALIGVVIVTVLGGVGVGVLLLSQADVWRRVVEEHGHWQPPIVRGEFSLRPDHIERESGALWLVYRVRSDRMSGDEIYGWSIWPRRQVVYVSNF